MQRTNIGRAALTGRAEYVGVRGLTTGVSFWTGKSGFELRPRLDVPVRLIEADARYSRDRFELRGQIASVTIDNAAELNDVVARTTGVNPNVARTLRGAYAEASYRVVEGQRWGDVGSSRVTRTSTRSSGCRPARCPFRRSIATPGRRRHLLAGSRHRGEGRLRDRPQSSSVVRAPNALNIGLGWWF